MKRLLIPVALGCTVLTLSASSASAFGGRRSGNVSTPYGQFSAAEMSQAGGNVEMAVQMREQKQMMMFQQQMFKQQQQYMQQQAKQQEFLKKHPEAAKALAQPATKTAVTKTAKKEAKAAGNDKKKAK